jgi:hypothetical protein
MKSYEDFNSFAEACKYKPGWEILCKEDNRGVFFQVSVGCDAEASISPFSGVSEPWKGAKHYVSPHMCDSEVVGCIFGAIKQAEEHEMREWFVFSGRRVFNPHISIWALHEIAGKKANLDLRENAMSMEETE